VALRTTATSLVLVAALIAPVAGADDVIEVAVFGNADVSRIVTIRPDGMISLPLIGEVRAAGLTPEQLRQRLAGLFATFLRTPQVAVIVREFRRVRVAVLGQVGAPGVYELAYGATILDALAEARGLAVDAGLGEVKLIRGQDPAVVIDLERLLLRGEIALNRYLESGDALVVPEDAAARVYVLGQVTQPRIVPLRGPMTAVQALTLAGGPTRRALLNRAHVIRREAAPVRPAASVMLATVVVASQPARVRAIPVDLHKVLLEGDASRDIPLQRGDVLYIPENPVALDNVVLLLAVVGDLATIANLFR
jgi:polysaccharide biosynthesis/export protein